MITTKDTHQTNQRVEETGKYVCAAGETKKFQKGEIFPLCPISNESTTWRHTEHVHKTGDKVTESGYFVDKDGEHIKLNRGESFPDCPDSHKPTTWKHAGN